MRWLPLCKSINSNPISVQKRKTFHVKKQSKKLTLSLIKTKYTQKKDANVKLIFTSADVTASSNTEKNSRSCLRLVFLFRTVHPLFTSFFLTVHAQELGTDINNLLCFSKQRFHCCVKFSKYEESHNTFQNQNNAFCGLIASEEI